MAVQRKPYLTYGIDNNHPEQGQVHAPSNRVLIERRSVPSPDYTVLLFPLRDGEALPATSWSNDRGTLTIDLGCGVVDTITFDRTAPDKRTGLTVSTQ